MIDVTKIISVKIVESFDGAQYQQVRRHFVKIAVNSVKTVLTELSD